MFINKAIVLKKDQKQSARKSYSLGGEKLYQVIEINKVTYRLDNCEKNQNKI